MEQWKVNDNDEGDLSPDFFYCLIQEKNFSKDSILVPSEQLAGSQCKEF
ncbi:MAG: hypothetical protein ACKVOW_21355 [Chitinophagaceae bacterium]